MIQTYFGNGKGKTTAAIGAAIRAAGSGEKVLFVQFFKNGNSSECCILRSVDCIDFTLPDDKYTLFEKPDAVQFNKRKTAFEQLLFSQLPEAADRYGMIVLDEVLDAVTLGYIDENRFTALLTSLKSGTEIVLTGHTEIKSITEISDYVSEVKEIKHPYKIGISPRKGIEY